MNWAFWQQHKKQFVILGGFITAFIALAVLTGMHFWQVYQQGLARCTAASDCSGLAGQLFQGAFEANLFHVIMFSVILMPMLLAVFFGLSLIGREYNEGTNLLVWTQGISRRRWLSAKVGWMMALTALAAGVVTATATWWWQTGNALHLTRFHPLDFVAQGIVPVALTIFAVAAAIALGAWFKRTLVALGILIGLLLVVHVGVSMFVRPHYAKPVLYTSQLVEGEDPGKAPTPPRAGVIWVNDAVITDANGKPLDWANPKECSRTMPELQQAVSAAPNAPTEHERDALISRDAGPTMSFRCLKEKGYHWEVRYQPAHRYWKFQMVESALYLVLSVPFVAATYWMVLRRDA